MRMKWLQEYQCWVFDDGRVAVPDRNGLKYRKPYLANNGYLVVSIKGNNRLLHRLLALAFIPNKENLPSVDHIDRNRTNNALSNLRWASWSTQCYNSSRSIISHEKYGGCKDKKAYDHNYYEANKDTIKQYQKDYNKVHREKVANRQKAYYSAHRDEILEYHRKYSRENRERLSQYHKEYYRRRKSKQGGIDA